jgi:hypothetical protein
MALVTTQVFLDARCSLREVASTRETVSCWPPARRSGLVREEPGGAFGIGEVWCLPPCGHCEEPLIGLPGLLGRLRAPVDARAAPVDVAGPQVDQAQGRRRYAFPGRPAPKGGSRINSLAVQ